MKVNTIDIRILILIRTEIRDHLDLILKMRGMIANDLDGIRLIQEKIDLTEINRDRDHLHPDGKERVGEETIHLQDDIGIPMTVLVDKGIQEIPP